MKWDVIFNMTKNEKRIFCIMNHDTYLCFINNNKCKKACRRMDICKQSFIEEVEWTEVEKELDLNGSEN